VKPACSACCVFGARCTFCVNTSHPLALTLDLGSGVGPAAPPCAGTLLRRRRVSSRHGGGWVGISAPARSRRPSSKRPRARAGLASAPSMTCPNGDSSGGVPWRAAPLAALLFDLIAWRRPTCLVVWSQGRASSWPSVTYLVGESIGESHARSSGKTMARYLLGGVVVVVSPYSGMLQGSRRCRGGDVVSGLL
jgi:hypothetical protein